MRLWPYLMDLTIGSPEREKPLHLWLPVVIVWPLLALVALLVFAVTVIADFVLIVVGQPYHHYTLFVYRIFALFSDLRGMVIHVVDDDTAVDMTLY